MMIIDQTSGQTARSAVHAILQRVAQKLEEESGRQVQKSLSTTIKQHFETRFPGSTHYSPDKVLDGDANENTCEVIVDVPGVSRAYHDVVIRPVKAQKLKIPLHRDAYGVENLFFLETKNGNQFLATNTSSGLALMYVLKDEVYQQKDSSIMPTDETMASRALRALAAWLSTN